MSSEYTDDIIEQEADDNNQVVADEEVSNDEKVVEKDPKEVQKQKVWEGMRDSYIKKVSVAGDKAQEVLDSIGSPLLRKEVEESLSKAGFVLNKEKFIEDRDKILVKKVKQEIFLDEIMSQIEEDKREEAKADYNSFLKSGIDEMSAYNKLRKLYDIKSESEIMAQGQRIRNFKSSGMGNSQPKQQLTPKEAKFAKAMGVEL